MEEKEKLTKQKIREEAANQIMIADAFVLITIGKEESCTSMFGDFQFELAASMAIHDMMGDKSNFYNNVVAIKDSIRKAMQSYQDAKNDPMYLIFKSMTKSESNDKKTSN